MENKKLWRKILKVFCSTIGLIILCTLYVCAGAALFSFIEGKNEENVKNYAFLVQLHANQRIKNVSEITFAENFTTVTEQDRNEHKSKVREIVMDLAKDYIKLLKEQSWDGETDNATSTTKTWRFANCALFAASIVTTIGYGHITPKTEAGRVLTIFYAIIGIPITVMTLAKMGHIMGRGFRYLYYYSVTFIKKLIAWDFKKSADSEHTEESSETHESMGLKETVKAQRIPVLLSLSIVVGYVLLGALAFQSATEGTKDWTYTESCYFCFVTISTIGFGDFVYGDEPVHETGEESAGESFANEKKVILTCLYIFVGMALNSMCIDLMAREVVRQAYWLAVKCNLAKLKKRKKKQTDDEQHRLRRLAKNTE